MPPGDDDRDKRKPITPPMGVQRQLARPVVRIPQMSATPGLIAPPVSKTPISDSAEPESWEDQSGGGRHVTAVKPKVDGESPLQAIERYTGTTLNTTADIQQQIAKLKKDLEETRALNTAQNAEIIGLFTLKERNALEAEREHAHIRARTQSGDLALARRERETEIDLRKEKWKAIWSWVGKVAAGASLLALGYLAKKCGV